MTVVRAGQRTKPWYRTEEFRRYNKTFSSLDKILTEFEDWQDASNHYLVHKDVMHSLTAQLGDTANWNQERFPRVLKGVLSVFEPLQKMHKVNQLALKDFYEKAHRGLPGQVERHIQAAIDAYEPDVTRLTTMLEHIHRICKIHSLTVV